MISSDPAHWDRFGKLPQESQNSPMRWGKPPEVDRIENITVEDDFFGGDAAIYEQAQKRSERPMLTIGSAQVQVREDDCIMHENSPEQGSFSPFEPTLKRESGPGD